MRTLQVIAGAQFGSEAKGHVTHRLVRHQPSWSTNPQSTAVVRVAGPNAGHTVYNNRGIKFALRQVPVAAVEDDVTLFIASGSEIDPSVLIGEILELTGAGHDLAGRLIIDQEATLIRPEHKQREGALVGGIGSTGKGIGAARADRALRGAERLADDDQLMGQLTDMGVVIAGNTGHALNHWGSFERVIIEGTQGYGLGQHAGMYPKVTSSDCRAIDFMAMAGVVPWAFDQIEIWLVARVHPIRVAGNSGPLRNETTWDALGLPPEFTTVTKKMRRVGEWDPELVRDAVAANGGIGGIRGTVRIALTMADQKIPGLADKVPYELDPDDDKVLDELIRQVEKDAGVPVGMITTGPRSGWML